MTDHISSPPHHGWTHGETRRRQIEAGASMTPSERIVVLEEMLDELLPLLGSARKIEERAVDPLHPVKKST